MNALAIIGCKVLEGGAGGKVNVAGGRGAGGAAGGCSIISFVLHCRLMTHHQQCHVTCATSAAAARGSSSSISTTVSEKQPTAASAAVLTASVFAVRTEFYGYSGILLECRNTRNTFEVGILFASVYSEYGLDCLHSIPHSNYFLFYLMRKKKSIRIPGQFWTVKVCTTVYF